ncbi:anther-specific proline-rich protein APG-like [Gossypium hirsutum]|uniref:Anther-specific proline-rich protein APG-like n=1 Tax=Gossypium hirsutum TaxID=3635 RepID=A0ABM3AHM7_GOSHI|nr:anther-specific proline-rich protein APG-like [Gossypium hirsutum]
MQSPSPTRAPTQSPDAAIQQMIPTQSPFPMMLGMFPSPYMYPNPYMYPFPNPMAGWSQMPGSAPFPVMPSGPPITRPAAQEGSQGRPSGSSPFYQSPATHGFQTPSPFMMQTPSHTLFFEDGSSSQVQQADVEPEEQQSPPEEEQPLPEARGRKNPARNRRRPPCGTESPGHRH